MANNIQLSVTFLCDEARLQEILEFIQCDYAGEDSEYGIGTIDFNKIVPMPQSLDIESGSKTNEGIRLYLTAINGLIDYYDDAEKLSASEFLKLMENESLQDYLEQERLLERLPLTPAHVEDLRSRWSLDDLLTYGKTCVENICNYGVPTWRQWCYENWGTKWNGYDFCYTPGSHTISFTTANGTPDPVFERLSALYEDVEIILNWGGYWAGGCGEVRFKNVECILDEIYDYCDISIDVPEILEYPNNYFNLMFVPEQFGIIRTDFPAVAAYVLQEAIDLAPSKGGAEALLNDKASFDQAVSIAIESANRYYEEALREQMEYLAKCLKEQGQLTPKESYSVSNDIALEESGASQQRNRYGIPATSPVPKS